LAALINQTVAQGKRLFDDLDTIAGSCLYLDFEDDADEFIRRSYETARGLGLDSPPFGVFYRRCNRPLIYNASVVMLGVGMMAIGPAGPLDFGHDLVGQAFHVVQHGFPAFGHQGDAVEARHQVGDSQVLKPAYLGSDLIGGPGEGRVSAT